MSSKPTNKITKLLFLRIKPININKINLGHIKIKSIYTKKKKKKGGGCKGTETLRT